MSLAWRRIDRHALADLLTGSRLVDSHAVGATTVYRLASGRGELLALSLPDGEALVIDTAAPAARRRRRSESAKPTPRPPPQGQG